MRVAICGATGFIGSHLVKFLKRKGVKVSQITRNELLPNNNYMLLSVLESCDAVINLAGATINHRWSTSYKEKIYNSRIETTRQLVAAINGCAHPPRLLINTSAVGIYKPNTLNTEDSYTYGDDYLASICKAWEREASKLSNGTQLVVTRLGVVLDPSGGMLKPFIQALKWRIAIKISKSNYPFSWIMLNDLLYIYWHILSISSPKPVYNCCTPTPTKASDLFDAIRESKRLTLPIVIPAWSVKLLFGEASLSLLTGRRVIPESLQGEGFNFKYRNIYSITTLLPKVN